MPPRPRGREVMFVAGETSGDLHAAGVVAALKRREPTIRVSGVGGERMEQLGVDLLERAERLAVLGTIEVVKHVPAHWALLRRLRERMAGGAVGLVILIDYPGFNLKVAAAAHELGVPVLYYITPQVWAWGSGRLARMAKTITRAAVILPFEETLLREHGIDTTFVGHPLLDGAAALPEPEAARRALGLDPDRPVLALFPGSRVPEIVRHEADFVATARALEQRVPGLQVVVSVAPSIQLDAARWPYPMVRGASFAVLRAATAALCKSGTTTLEAAVAGCPHVVAYRAGRLTYALAYLLLKVRRIGLVNIVAGRDVAPEFVQGSLEPARIADALEPLLRVGSPERARMVADLAEVRGALGESGAADRVAEMALGMLGDAGSRTAA